MPRRPDTAVRTALVTVELLVAGFAIWGGTQMIAGTWDLPMDWLRHTPFDSWVVPGVALLALPGLGVLAAAVAAASRLPGDRTLSLLAGAGLVAWIVVQVVWLRQLHPVMQPTIAVAGLVVALLASRLPARRATAPGVTRRGRPPRARRAAPV